MEKQNFSEREFAKILAKGGIPSSHSTPLPLPPALEETLHLLKKSYF